jgi:hypothetical protein
VVVEVEPSKKSERKTIQKYSKIIYTSVLHSQPDLLFFFLCELMFVNLGIERVGETLPGKESTGIVIFGI